MNLFKYLEELIEHRGRINDYKAWYNVKTGELIRFTTDEQHTDYKKDLNKALKDGWVRIYSQAEPSVGAEINVQTYKEPTEEEFSKIKDILKKLTRNTSKLDRVYWHIHSKFLDHEFKKSSLFFTNEFPELKE